jgi:HAD domain in Swiss Army Knife RNA repair proteins
MTMATMNCILFLDFDGVTHPDPCREVEYFRQLPLIEDVLRDQRRVYIVISSSWRYDHTIDELRDRFSPDLRSRVIDVTPSVTRTDDEGWIPRHLLQHHREWECRKWLRHHKAADVPWIAIDDVAEWFTPECPHLLVTMSDCGFTLEQAEVLRRMIKERQSLL